MIGLIIAVSVLGVAFVTTAIVMGIKLYRLTEIVGLLAAMQIENAENGHKMSVGDTDVYSIVYSIDFPNSHKEF